MEPSSLCAWIGAGLLGLFLVCVANLWRSRDGALWQAALPWLVACGYGGVNAALITYGRLRVTMESALAHRYVTFTLFFTVGLLGLWWLLMRRHRWMAQWAPWLAAATVVLQMVTWTSGLNVLRVSATQMDQEKYALCFSKILPLEAPLIWQPNPAYPTTGLAIFLHSTGRLRGVDMLTNLDLAPLKSQRVINAKFANFDIIHRLSDGATVATGTCALNKGLIETPDLILITAQRLGQPEQIIGITNPQLPDIFLDRGLWRRMHPYHYFHWELTLDPALWAAGEITVRAYGFDGEKRKASSFEQSFVLPIK
jgi:hypothetical protein